MNTTLFVQNAALHGFAGQRRPGLFELQYCDSDRRRRYHSADLYARAANGFRARRAEDYLSMFLARIDGTLTSTVKHETLGGFRFLIAQRLEGDGSDSGEPQILVDWMGANVGSIVLVSTDDDIAESFGKIRIRCAWR